MAIMGDKLEIYKMAAEMADRVSARRMVANGFFLTVNTALVTIGGYIYLNIANDKHGVLILMGLVGILINATWFFSIRSYKKLNMAKYAVIGKMEKDLPYQNFSDEWEILKRQKIDGSELKSWRNQWLKFKDRYTELTNVEGTVPIAFGLIYVIVIVGIAFGVIIK